ncbi:hypothetical protein Varpa_2868 [Variovorax paradoxus EPS]|uniref:Uncharacterized protein n=1 Tax=Variovorax paradoxus (strain EPS) TaxID=595537 RepID=E6V4X3_VARPE|nr:hypothetical protein Varpa_2868 [Variovorax paradoxus EPS]
MSHTVNLIGSPDATAESRFRRELDKLLTIALNRR